MNGNTHGWIWIRGLPVADTRVGVYDYEHKQTQEVVIDTGLWTQIAAAGQSDAVEDTVDWAHVVRAIEETTRSRHFRLVESLCERLAAMLLERFPTVERVQVEVRKTTCLPMGVASVAIERSRFY